MDFWLIWVWLLCLTGIIFLLWKRAKQFQQAKNRELQIKDRELQTKDKKLQTKDKKLQTKDIELATKTQDNKTLKKQVSKLLIEKDKIEAKYVKKIKAAEEKKKNLAKYRKKKRNIRKSLAEKAAEIVGKGNKWLPHSSSNPKSHKIGKPKGSKGGGDIVLNIYIRQRIFHLICVLNVISSLMVKKNILFMNRY